MPERKDDLFSPERLRERWNERDDVALPAAGSPPEDVDLVELARRLEQLSARFGGPGAEALRALVVRLRAALERMSAPELGGDEATELGGDVRELLGQIDALAEATELGQRRAGRR